jgi:hypothetical protein
MWQRLLKRKKGKKDFSGAVQIIQTDAGISTDDKNGMPVGS